MRSTVYTFAAVLLSFSVAALAAACSSPSPEGEGPSPYAVKKTKKGTTETNGTTPQEGEEGNARPPPKTPPKGSGGSDAGTSPPATDSGTTTGPPTGACAGQTTSATCFSCCETNHPAGIQFLQQAFGDCACNPNAAGNCSEQCSATFCQGLTPSAICDDCLNVATTCENTADTACAGNAACAAMLQCDTSSQCSAKP